MPPTNPRIIVADTKQTLHHIVRAAMDLLERRPRLVETYTGDDALLELRVSSPDLLITAQTLVDSTDGPELAVQAKRELAALSVIVVGAEDDPPPDDETLGLSLFQYLRRPFAPETFIRTLRVALDGPEAVPKETSAEEIVPVPPIDHGRLKTVMFELMRDVGAMAVILADRNGKVVAYEGAAGYVDRDALAAALGPGFGDTMKILPLIGDQPRVLKFYDGERGNLFGLALGLHHFLMLIYEGNAPASALGNVKRYGFAAVNEMLNVVGPVAFEPRPSLQHAVAETQSTSRRRSRRTQEAQAVRASAEGEKPRKEKEAEPKKDGGESTKPTANAATNANFDPTLLDALDQIDPSEAEALFDPETLAVTAADASSERISFDDALMQGIIGDIEE